MYCNDYRDHLQRNTHLPDEFKSEYHQRRYYELEDEKEEAKENLKRIDKLLKLANGKNLWYSIDRLNAAHDFYTDLIYELESEQGYC